MGHDECRRQDHGSGNPNVLVTERGASFGYNTLVSDMRALPILARAGEPVIFDATFGAAAGWEGGRPAASAASSRRWRAPRSRSASPDLHRDASGPRQCAVGRPHMVPLGACRAARKAAGVRWDRQALTAAGTLPERCLRSGRRGRRLRRKQILRGGIVMSVARHRNHIVVE